MKNTIKIANKEYFNVSLAPMAGVADKAYRLLCNKHHCGFSTSEMISAKAVMYNDKKTFDLANISNDEGPVSIQIFGHEPLCMANATSVLISHLEKNNVKPLTIDINMGCPVPKVIKNGDGSALMKTPDVASLIIKETVNAAGEIPVSVKMRLGWDLNNINVVDFAKIAEQSGASLLTIHARTRSQLYSPGVNWDYIRQVKENVNIPVIGNGDVYTKEDAKELLKTTNCDGIAIARGSLGNPWIFDEIYSLLNSQEYYPPTKEEIIDEAIAYLHLMIETKGAKNGLIESRKVLSAFTKGMYGSPYVRNALNLASKESEVVELLNSLK